jgi:hypothetical protein
VKWVVQAVNHYGNICDQTTKNNNIKLVFDRPSLEEFKTEFPEVENGKTHPFQDFST